MEPVTRVAVHVTFLRMDHAPPDPAPPLPEGTAVIRLVSPTVSFYRYLYATVGGPYLWWLRRAVPDEQISMLLRSPGVSVHVL